MGRCTALKTRNGKPGDAGTVNSLLFLNLLETFYDVGGNCNFQTDFL